MRKKTLRIAGIVAALSGTAFALGIPADIPFVTVDPRVDGADSFPGEWTDALITSDGFVDPTTGITPGGRFYWENKTDWMATSSAGNTALYPGPTLFIAHDIFGAATGLFASFRTNDPGDWNYVKIVTSAATTVECWNFGGFSNPTTPPHVPPSDLDAPDDGVWLPDAAGLGSSSLIPEGAGPNLIVDVGFIVRLNEDPSTDRHWMPGFPEPGDPGWDWADYYGCFARAGFNKTFQTNGTDTVAAHDFEHEVYEWCFHEALPVMPPPLQCLEWRAELIDPPKRWVIFVAPDWFIHFGPPPVPAIPWAGLVALAALLAGGGAWAFGRRRPPRALPVVLVAGLGLALAGCGGGGGGGEQKFPPPFLVPVPVINEGWIGQPYSCALPVQGATPPLVFALTAGALPPGLTLDPPTGLISGTPTTEGRYPFEFSVTDSLVRRVDSGSSIHVGDPGNVPIEIVSLSLVSVQPILVFHSGQEGIGSIRTRGGDYFSPIQFQLNDPAPPGFQLSPGGVIRWTPDPSFPFGPFTMQVQIANGLNNVILPLQFDVQP
jgi:hypothetical protein